MSDTTKLEATDAGVRAHTHRMWASVAPAWGEYAEYTDRRHAPETALMLDATDPQAGERVLELACGAGGLGLLVAERVGAGGEVVQSDVAPEMTEIAARRAAARGITNAPARVLDLEAIDEPDRSYDVVLCRDGLQFAVDPSRAAREITRVLRPGGRVALAVWGPRDRNPWLGIVLDAASAQLGRPMPPPGLPGPFSLGDGEELRRVLAGAGLAAVAITEVSVPMRAASFDEWWSRTSSLAGPLSSILAAMPPEAANELRSRARAASAPFMAGAGLDFEGLALVATARRATGARA